MTEVIFALIQLVCLQTIMNKKRVGRSEQVIPIHSSVREKCSLIWTGAFYWSKKVNILELSLTQIVPGNFKIQNCYFFL
jgi:hypothetical protein